MISIQTTGIIRDRGQLTIPDHIRKMLQWAAPFSAVTISVKNPDEIVITPHQSVSKVKWDEIWKGITLLRTFQGKGSKKSAKDLINEDRAGR